MSKGKFVDMSIDPSTIKSKPKDTESDVKSLVPKKARKEPNRRPSHHKGQGKVSAKVCVKLGDKVQYVSRKAVQKNFIDNGWSFCPKSEWKKLVRDKKEVVEVPPDHKEIYRKNGDNNFVKRMTEAGAEFEKFPKGHKGK
jgi:hypothetical protein